MKSKFIFLPTLFMSVFTFAQVPFPHLAPNLPNNAERVASFGVSGISNEFLEITNSTEFAGQFIPSIWAHHEADNRFVLRHFATTNATRDNGNIPLMVFRAEIRNNLNTGAPNSLGQFPWGTSSAKVVNRPVFGWENGDTQLLRILANGNIGIGTISPTAKLHTYGNIRFENIPTTTSNTYVLTTDENGLVSRQLSNSLGGGNSSLCTDPNFLIKQGSTGLNCSQIFDNGLSVGIGTASNFFFNTTGLATTTTGYTTGILKLNIAGVTRGNVFISTSDASFKLNVEPIDNPLEKILNLKGVSYNWDTNKYPEMNFDNSDHTGLIAQEVEKVLPHLVYTVSEHEKQREGKKSVNYIELIPYLIESIKIQQSQIDELQNLLKKKYVTTSNKETILSEDNKINNISPNPSSDTVFISMKINNDVKDAKLVFHDSKGAFIKNITIKEKGNDVVETFKKDNFGRGVYLVNLLINGQNIDSKKIIFN